MTDREKFEAWADSRKGASLRSSATEDYDYPLGRLMFEAWTASRAEAMEEAATVAVAGVLQWPVDDPVRVQAEEIAGAIRAGTGEAG